MASISSKKMMAPVSLLRAWANRSRTREAPTPTKVSTKSDPESAKKGTPDSPATALASSVLPVPGGPCRITPRGMRAPTRAEALGLAEEDHDLLELLDGLVAAGDVGEAHRGRLDLGVLADLAVRRRRRRARRAERPPDCVSRISGHAADHEHGHQGDAERERSGSA